MASEKKPSYFICRFYLWWCLVQISCHQTDMNGQEWAAQIMVINRVTGEVSDRGSPKKALIFFLTLIPVLLSAGLNSLVSHTVGTNHFLIDSDSSTSSVFPVLSFLILSEYCWSRSSQSSQCISCFFFLGIRNKRRCRIGR